MPRGRKKRNRLRQKRFEEEIVDTSQNIFAAIGVNAEDVGEEQFKQAKQCIGKMIKRLLDQKLLREQEFYLGDWVFTTKDKSNTPVEIIDINYNLRTARIKDKKEGEIWVKFNDIIKDDDFYYV